MVYAEEQLSEKIISAFFIVENLALGAKEYIASAEGYNGDIQVKVEVDNKVIKNIEVIKHEESNFTKRAMKTISEEIIGNQSLDVVVGGVHGANRIGGENSANYIKKYLLKNPLD